MDAQSGSDDDLMKAYYGCDEQAWKELDNRYRDVLAARSIAKLKWFSGWEELVGDLADDALFKLMRTKYPERKRKRAKSAGEPSRFKPEKATLRTYLYQIHDNIIRDFVEASAPKPPPAVDAAATDNYELEALRECLEQLPADLRDFVLMRFAQQKTGKEIAQEQQTSAATISRRLNDALAQLRACLSQRGILL